MTIEEVLSRLAMNTGRIAAALEALVESQGIVSSDTPSSNRDLFDDDDEPEVEKPKPAAKKKTKKKTSKKKKVANKTKVGKDDDDDDGTNVPLTIEDDVRPVLKKMREEISHAAVKSLLKKYGASTLKDLKPKQYAAVIAEAKDEIGDYDDDDDEVDI